MLQNRLFFALASRSGFGATISDAIARSSLVFCNSSHWNGCFKVVLLALAAWRRDPVLELQFPTPLKAATWILLADFLHFGTQCFFCCSRFRAV